ncbi:MAG: phytoene/squalene synthase family protein [Flavobacteriales bacterium]|nr:phytoene/squalene synthase family protein [Flavobacteriales bacterium]
MSKNEPQKVLFDRVSHRCSRTVTNTYSTSFSLAIRFLHKDFEKPIHGIYGFVRFADEIVDSFHDFPKAHLLERFKEETYRAIDEKISLNPILNSFQFVVNQYGIDRELIDRFLASMEMDLRKEEYTQEKYEEYILGSAEVVGLMCLKVFTEGEAEMYENLKAPAMKLGSAFQKINFLRDLKADYNELGRSYFPGIDVSKLDDATKQAIEADIQADFDAGYEGILNLPKKARFGVYLAYIYYTALFNKISKTPSTRILHERISISKPRKASLLFGSYVRHSFNLI